LRCFSRKKRNKESLGGILYGCNVFYRSGRDARFVFTDAAVWPLRYSHAHALHAGQSIREVGPQWHNTKAGTPTMGGIMFIAAIILCTVGFGWKSMTENHTYTHLYVLALALCYGLVGFADDFVKVKLKRNLGLTAVQKFLLQLVVAAAFLFVRADLADGLACMQRTEHGNNEAAKQQRQ